MRLGSLFAGIGGFDLAAERAGLEVAWQSEIDSHASRVLDHHWPAVKNYGDIHEIRDTAGVDVLVGGFPCQDYSVAGKRGGLAADRGALWWEFHRLIAEGRPRWIVGENVPGLLSSNDGRDFATIISSLVGLGYGVVWRVFDAQWFGVAQRRRRVFIVGHSGGIPRPEVLALGQSVSGDSPPRRETGERTAPTLAARTRGGGGLGTDTELDGALIAQTVTTGTGLRYDPETETLIAFLSNRGHDDHRSDGLSPTIRIGSGLGIPSPPAIAIQDTTRMVKDQNGVGYSTEDVGYTLDGQSRPGIAFAQNTRDEVRDLGNLAGALSAEPGMKQTTYTSPTVRRLTPLECERLQGFPDGWTDIPGNSDTQRYRQLGNAVAVPVVEWILKRLVEASE